MQLGYVAFDIHLPPSTSGPVHRFSFRLSSPLDDAPPDHAGPPPTRPTPRRPSRRARPPSRRHGALGREAVRAIDPIHRPISAPPPECGPSDQAGKGDGKREGAGTRSRRDATPTCETTMVTRRVHGGIALSNWYISEERERERENKQNTITCGVHTGLDAGQRFSVDSFEPHLC